MRNTSTKLSAREPHLPKVEVLLATFNGAPYLTQFLDSLTRQKGVRVHLLVSDDGSTDNSLGIVNKYSQKFESLTIYEGPQRGPAANFFFLMTKANYDYLFLADQDDIWEPDHAINAIQRLRGNQGPALTYCRTLNFGTKIRCEIWPRNSVTPTLQQFLVENNARGCTMAFNKSMLNLNNLRNPTKVVMHDWWLALLAHSCGTIIFSPTVEVRYRLHENNAVGVNKLGLRQRVLRVKKESKWAPGVQANELLYLFGNQMHPNAKKEIERFTNSLRGDWKDRLIKLTFSKKRFRASILDEFIIRAGFLLFPVFFTSDPDYSINK